MITKEFLKTKLECSDMYAQKLIDEAQGDENSYLSKNLQNVIHAPLSSNIKEC